MSLGHGRKNEVTEKITGTGNRKKPDSTAIPVAAERQQQKPLQPRSQTSAKTSSTLNPKRPLSTANSAPSQIGEPARKSAVRLSKQRLDPHKTSNPFSDKKKHRTKFGKLYDDGAIPCRIMHSSVKMSLHWNILPHDGIRETNHPYVFISRAGFKDLLAAPNAKEKVILIMERLCMILRQVLQDSTPGVFEAGIDAIAQLSECSGDALVNHLPLLLVQLGKKCFDKKMQGKIFALLSDIVDRCEQQEAVVQFIKSKLVNLLKFNIFMSDKKKQVRYRAKSHALGAEAEEAVKKRKERQLLPLEERNRLAEEEMSFKGEKWWETGNWTEEMNEAGSVEQSDFTLLFPSYREMYFKQVWPLVVHIIEKQLRLSVKIDYEMGTMTVATTDKTFDPFAIVSGRDLLLLMARGVSLERAKQILVPGITFDIIKTKRYVRNYKVFMNRRQRLIGPNGATLKAIELLTNTHLVVQGKTMTTLGPLKGIKEIRRLVDDCMNNIHPIYHIKMLMVKRELEKNPKLANEDWSRFLPKFKKTVNKKKKKTKSAAKEEKKKEYTPFPPPIEKSKLDIELETGQYFLTEQQKSKKQQAEKSKKQQQQRMESMGNKLVQKCTPQPEQQQSSAQNSSKSTEEIVQKWKNKKQQQHSLVTGQGNKRKHETIQELLPTPQPAPKKQKTSSSRT